MKKIEIFMTSMLLTLGLTVGCGKNEPTAPKAREILRVNIAGEPATMDPRKGGDIVSSHLHFMLFEGLTRMTPAGTVEGAQADKIDISEDGKTYTFHLRDAKWSDGSPVTALDFEKSWKDILDPTFPAVNAHLFYPIKNAEAAKHGTVPLSEVGIRAQDEKTLIVELSQPTPYFLELTSFCVFFPVNSTIDQQCPDWAYHANEHFVSNGPFSLAEWKHHDEILLKKSATYWESERVKLGGMRISMINNELTALQMYENGDLDMIGQPLSTIPADALHVFKAQGTLKINPVAGTTILAFNINQFPFTNKNIRKAFAYAINRDAISKNITQLNELPAVGAIPPVLKKNSPTAFYKDADYEQARTCLKKGIDELGISAEALNDLTYAYISSELNHKIAQAIQQQWLEVLGIKVKIVNNEHKIHMDKLTKRDFMIAQTAWVAQYHDPMNILERFKFKGNAKNYASWENPDYIKLIERSAYEKGEERLKTIELAEAIFVEEMPVVPLLHMNFGFLAKPYLKEITLSPIGDIFFERITIDQPSKG